MIQLIDQTSKISKQRATKILFGAYIVYIGANALSFLMGMILLESFLPDYLKQIFYEFRASLQRDPIMIFLNIGPFPIVSVLVFMYFKPLLRFLGFRNRKIELKATAQRRILNSPLALTFITALSWIMALTLIQVYIQSSYQHFPADYRFRAVLVFSMCGLFASILCFNLFDYMSRKWYIPWFFLGQELNETRPWFTISLSRRQMIGWLGLSLFPISLFVIYISGFQAWPVLMLTVVGIGLFLTFLTYILARLFAVTLRLSLNELTAGVKKIQNQDYSVIVPLRSQDEVGILAQAVNQLARSLSTEQQLQRTLGQVVDPLVRDHLLSNPLDWGTKTVEVSVLFCDIRAFTKFSSTRGPQEVTEFLNDFFELTAPVVEKHGGHINKYLGDAFMAIFGAPNTLEDPKKSALQAGLEILSLVSGLDKVDVALGIHCGPVLAGAVGTAKRREYTIIGDTVNSASRFESLAKSMDYQAVISQELIGAGQVPGPTQLGLWQDLGLVEIRGKDDSMRLWGLKTKPE